jgi:hypothetical protein
VRLVETIARADVLSDTVFVSLNYELLLEQALHLSGRKPHYGFAHNGDTLVLKPHGSCNWLVEPRLRARGTGNTQGGPMIALVGGDVRLVPASIRQVVEEFEAHLLIPPAMSLYAIGKPSMVAPIVVDEVRREYERRIAGAERIIMIGVAPYERDDHLFRPMIDATADIFYVGADDPVFRERAGTTRVHHVTSAFEDALEALTVCFR